MAKNKIHPEGFRLGKSVNWNSNIKLQFYKKHVRSSLILSNQFKNIIWWQKKNFLNQRKIRKFAKLPIRTFFEKSIQLDLKLNYRRRALKFKLLTCLHGFYQYPKVFDYKAQRSEGFITTINSFKQKPFLLNAKNYFFRNSINLRSYFDRNINYCKLEAPAFKKITPPKILKVKTRRLLELKKYTDDNKEILYEKRLVLERNILNFKILNYQKFFPYFIYYTFQNFTRGLRGSTSLRRYQYCLDSITPSDWYKSIKLKTKSYKKIVGSLDNNIYTPDIPLATNMLATNLNIALHWHSSLLFAKTLAFLVERKKGASGFLRLFGGALVRLQGLRFNVTSICINIKGSFGKITRTKTIRLGKKGILQKKNLTTFDQLVSYTNLQSITKRGVLGISVWLYWT